MNPMMFMQLQQRIQTFQQDHPKFVPFLMAIKDNALQEGTVLGVIVLVNCTLILVFLLNVCTVFELIVEENPSDKTLHPLPLIARKCRIKSCKLPSTIRYSPK